MSEIIRHGEVVTDDWQVLKPAIDVPVQFPLPEGRILVPLAFWVEHHPTLIARGGAGVWLASDEDATALVPWLTQLPLIAVDFPKFTDGRGFSTAFLLRSRWNYQGELRAIGDVLPDQLFFMWRVGFDAFALRADKNIHQALQLLKPFSDAYQGSWDNVVPAYKRHHRDWPSGHQTV